MNLVTATTENPKLWSMVPQDTSSYIRSVMVASTVAMMNSSAMNGSLAKQIIFLVDLISFIYSSICINSEEICNIVLII